MLDLFLGRADGVLDRLGGRTAVADQHQAIDTQQGRAAVLGIIKVFFNGPEHRQAQKPAYFPENIFTIIFIFQKNNPSQGK